MRCRNCEYPLWNIAGRACPECGHPFSPREATLRPGSVRFCCPHCDQQYFGTSPQGLLEPDVFDCVTCHRRITLDEMVVRPQPGVAEADTRLERLPWLRRRQIGRLRAWFATIGQALVAPRRLADGIPPEASPRTAWYFAVGTLLVYLLPGLLLPHLFSLLVVTVTGAGGGAGPFPPGTLMIFMMVMWITLGVAIAVIMPLAWPLLTHLLLLITGGTRQGLRRTWQCICYTSGAGVLYAMPCMPYFGWIWWMVSASAALRRMHGIGTLRATLAVVTGGILTLILSGVGWIAGVGVGGALVAPAMTVVVPPSPPRAINPAGENLDGIMNAIVEFERANDGRLPAHGLELLDFVSPIDFVMAGGMTTDDVRIPGGTLTDLYNASPERLEEALRHARARVRDAVTHRVGDFVFISAGAIKAADAPELAVVVFIPGSSPTTVVRVPKTIAVGFADGSIEGIPTAGLGAWLKEQNEVRSALGLPPIPADALLPGPAPADVEPAS